MTADHAQPRHSLIDDAVGLSVGVVLGAMAIHLFTQAGLVTGQTAGTALLIAYATGWESGPVFFVINAPFYVLAVMRLGWVFTFRTFLAVAGVSALVAIGPRLMPLGEVDPFAAAIAASVLAGVALVVLFRHRASLGGIGVVGLLIQDRTGFRAGWTQLIVDSVIFLAALLVLEWKLVLISAAGAFVLNLTVALNHRTDRYIAR